MITPDLLPETVSTQEDIDLLVEALDHAVKSKKALETEYGVVSAKNVVKDFQANKKPFEVLEEAARARLVEARRLYENAVNAAIDMGTAVPEDLTHGSISFRKVRKYRHDGMVDPSYMKVVVDEEKVKAAVEAGVDVYGVNVFDDFVLVFKPKSE